MRKLAVSWVLALLSPVSVLGCSDDKSPAGTDSAGSAVGGTSGVGGGAGANASAGTGGSGGAGGGSGGATEPPTCTEQQVACNGACLDVGASMNGCTVLLRVEGGIDELALDESHVYFRRSGNNLGGIWRWARGAPAEPQEFAPDVSVGDLALNASHVFWTEGDAVYALPKAGGTATTLHTDTVDLVDLAASADRVFFARHPFSESHQVVSVDLTGQNRVDNGVAGFTDEPLLAVDEGFVYWSDITGLQPSNIKRSAHSGTEDQVLVTVEGIDGLFVAGGSVYFEESDGQTSSLGSIVKIPVAGGEPTVLADGLKLEREVLLANAAHVFWNDQGTLYSAALDGQSKQAVLATVGRIEAAVADDTAAYAAVVIDAFSGPSYLIQLAP